MKHPITGRPLTIVAAALATVPTGFFLAALITGGVNVGSSILTLATWWLGVVIVAIFESNPRPARTNREEH